MTYDQWYSQYMTLYKTDLKSRTLEGYDSLHRLYISPIVGGIDLASITPEDLQAVLIAAGHAGGRTSTACFDLLRAVLRRAVRSRLLVWSPLDALDRPRHHPQPGRALTESDYAIACEIAEDDLAVALALHAGLRRGELLALSWRDVNLAEGVLHVTKEVLRTGGKLQCTTPKSATGVRDVPIAPLLAPILKREYRLTRAPCVELSPEAVTRRWHREQIDAGIVQPYRLHDLRHTYATRLLLAGCNLKVVQYCMGHSDSAVTARVYVHVGATEAITECARVYAALQ